MLDTALAAAAAVVAVAFSMSTFERWLERRRRHELCWSLAFLLFAIASAALAYGAQVGWTQGSFKVFYLFGAIANVPVLALGTVELLWGARVGRPAGWVVGGLLAYSAGVVTTCRTGPIPLDRLPQGSEVLPVLPRVFAGVFSGGAALVVLGGALWSAWRVRRGRLVVSNALIAAGTLVTGASGLLNSVGDEMLAFSITLLVGICTIYAGFLVATTGPRRVAAAATAVPRSVPRPA